MSDDLVERLRESGSRSEVELHEDREEAADRIEGLEDRLEKAEQMLEREIRRVRKIQLDLPPPHTVGLFSVQSEYELMLKELKGETK